MLEILADVYDSTTLMSLSCRSCAYPLSANNSSVTSVKNFPFLPVQKRMQIKRKEVRFRFTFVGTFQRETTGKCLL